jgi:hypothetical protein
MVHGLALAEHFYFDCVQPLIAQHLPTLHDAYAAGLIGYGSDVIGNDDELSRDHEWGPRLVLFLHESVYGRFAGELDSLLSHTLPPTFGGFPTRFQPEGSHGKWLVMSTSGQGRHHIVITTVARFMELTLGCCGVPQHDREWLLLPEQRLLEFTSGAIFADPVGEITHYRTQCRYFPTEVWKYKLAYIFESLSWNLDLIALCGQRNDVLSMHLNVASTVERTIKLAFSLSQRYCPGYKKWLHREFVKLPLGDNGQLAGLLHQALLANNHVDSMHHLHVALEILYQKLLAHNVAALPVESPRDNHRGSVVMNTLAIARVLLASLIGPLRELTIHGVPYGGIDQWITHEDMLLSPDHLRTLMGVFNAQMTERTLITEDMI